MKKTMKKVWIIGLILIIIGAIIALWFLTRPFSEQNLPTVKYQDREYRLGSSQGLTVVEVKDKYNSEIVSSGSFYKKREIFISSIQPMIYPYIPTIIFLKQKNSNLFDAYSLVGGP